MIVVGYKLIVGGRLYILPGFELAFQHMVYFHPHKSGIGIGLAYRVAPAHLLIAPIVLVDIPWPVRLGIIELLSYYFIDVLSLECPVNPIDCIG